MIPHEKTLVKRLENEPFVLFGINTDEDPEYYRKQAAAMGVTWPNLFEGSTKGPVPTKWGVSGYPTVYVIDADGIIRYRDLRGEELEHAVMGLIAEAKGEKPKGGHGHGGDGHDGDGHNGGGHDADGHGHDGDAGHDDEPADGKGEAIPAVPLRPGK